MKGHDLLIAKLKEKIDNAETAKKITEYLDNFFIDEMMRIVEIPSNEVAPDEAIIYLKVLRGLKSKLETDAQLGKFAQKHLREEANK